MNSIELLQKLACRHVKTGNWHPHFRPSGSSETSTRLFALDAEVETPDSDEVNASKVAKPEVLGAEVLGGAKLSKLGVTRPVSCTSGSETSSDGRDRNV